MDDILKYYKVTTKDLSGFELKGLTIEDVVEGEECKLLAKAFITSDNSLFFSAVNMISSFVPGIDISSELNKILIIINNENKANIYLNYPLSMNIHFKPNVLKKQNDIIKKGTVIFKNEILDMTEIVFKDGVINLDIQDSNKIIWLFRLNWRFGLYFDFTGNLLKNTIGQELASYYRYLSYINIYEEIEKETNDEIIFKNGWFPFIQLIINDDYNHIIRFIKYEDKKRLTLMQSILIKYDEKMLNEMCDNWWKTEIFMRKREILKAGIEAYLQKTNSGYITSIKTLSTEIEDIIKTSIEKNNDLKMNKKKFKEYIKERGLNKFKTKTSMFFPEMFYEYLSNNVFRHFNDDELIPDSRHAFAHGKANENQYTQERALQMILTIDQINYFIK